MCPHLIERVLADRFIIIFQLLVTVIFNNLLLVGRSFVFQSNMQYFLFASQINMRHLDSRKPWNFFFLSFCPVFFLSLVPIKRHKTVIIIFLGCSAHCDPGYSTQFMHIKQKLGAKFFQLKFPEAFYSYLMPIIPYPILTQLTQQKKKRTQCAKISKPVTAEVEIGD